MSGQTGRAAFGLAFTIVSAALLSAAGVPAGAWLAVGTATASIAGSLIAAKLFPIKQQASQEPELSITNSTLGQPVTVVFGIAQLSPTAMDYDLAHLRAEDQKAGKGGGGQKTGTKYWLKYEHLLCCGEIDRIIQIYTSPGNEPLISGHEPWGDWATHDKATSGPIQFGNNDHLDIPLHHPGDADIGGTVRVYKGSPTQTRVPTNDPYAASGLNHRRFCWALFGADSGGYSLGTAKSTPSYRWIVQRTPRVLDDNGNDTGINPHGSIDATHIHYLAANPAAMLYEVLTNKDWGLGISSDLIDINSFKLASDYYARYNIGINLAVNAFTAFDDIVKSLAVHCKCDIAQDGTAIRLVNLLVSNQDISTTPTLSEDNIDKLEITAVTYQSLKSRVVVDWTDPKQAFRNASIDARSQMSAEADTDARTSRQSLAGFMDAAVAKQQCQRLLYEICRPSTSFKCQAGRELSFLQRGDLVQLRHSLLTKADGKTIMIPCRIMRVQEAPSDSEKINIEFIEDTNYQRQILAYKAPTESAQGHPNWKSADISVSAYGRSTITADPFPFLKVFEIPSRMAVEVLNTSANYGAILAPKQPTVISVDAYASEDGTNFKKLGQTPSLGILIELVDPLPSTVPEDRTSNIAVNCETYWADVMTNANKVMGGGDPFTKLTQQKTDYLLIDNEIIQIGYAYTTNGTKYIKNLLRGCYGTGIQPHAAGAKGFYFSTLGFTPLSFAALPIGKALTFRAYPVTPTSTIVDDAIDVTATLKGLTTCPPAPVVVGVVNSTLLDLTISPVVLAPTGATIRLESDPYHYIAEQWNGSTKMATDSIDSAWDNTTKNSTASLPIRAGATEIRIFSVTSNGRTSADYSAITIP